MQGNAIVCAVAALFASAAQADVGRVYFAVGDVSAVAPDGERRRLAKGAEVRIGDTVSIREGRAQLRFADGAYMSLQPHTEFKIEDFRFHGTQDGSETIVMHLLKGGLRTITGLIGHANRQNYKLHTHAATIGIRGTEFSVRSTDTIEVFCAEGSILVQNETGTVPLNSGEGARIVSAQAVPSKTDQPPVLSPQASPTTQVEEPLNPVQEKQATVASTLTGVVDSLPVPSARLTGTFSGNWAASTAGTLKPVRDAHTNESVTLDAQGSLLSFSEGIGSVTTPGTSTLLLDGNDGSIAWGRWVGGLVVSTGSFAGADTSVAPLHWVAGLPTPNMPSGSASYAMIGATPASCVPSCSAFLQSSSLDVLFDQKAANLHMSLDVGGKNFSSSASGIPLTISGATFSGSGSLVMPGSGTSGGTSSGTLAADGFFSGDAAARAGLAYHFDKGSQMVDGAIAYKKQ
jgi:hypothetical protein